MTCSPPKSNRSDKALLCHLGFTAQDPSSHSFLCGQTVSGKTTVLRILVRAQIQLLAQTAIQVCIKADDADANASEIQILASVTTT